MLALPLPPPLSLSLSLFIAAALYSKKKLNSDVSSPLISDNFITLSLSLSLSLSSQMGKVEILFYNALVVFFPALILAAFSGDLTKVRCNHYGNQFETSLTQY